MICFLCVILLIVTLILNKQIKGRYLCAGSIYVMVWYTFLALSSFGLFGLYIPSQLAYMIAIVSCIVFSIVSFLWGSICFPPNVKKYTWRNYRKNNIKVLECEHEINYGVIYFLHLVAYVFSIPFCVRSIKVILQYGFGYLRGVESSVIGQTTYTVLAFQWLLLPLFTMTMCLAGIDFSKKHKFSSLVYLSIIDAAIYALTYGGRYVVAKLLFYFVIAALLENTESLKQFLRKQKKIIGLSIVVLFLLIYMTSLRSLSGFGFAGNVIGYFTGSFIFFSQLLEFQSTPLYYGQLSFGLILNFIKSVLKVLFSVDYTGSDVELQLFLEKANYLPIGQKTVYNAMPTWLYSFVIDFGTNYFWIGIIIMAVLINTIEKKYYKTKSLRYKLVYMFMLFVCFDSILRDNLISPGAFVTCFLPLVLVRKSHHKENYYE